MGQLVGLFALFVGVLLLQTVVLSESFAASDGGALIQLAASRPVYYVVRQ
jgi:hypothetical protein